MAYFVLHNKMHALIYDLTEVWKIPECEDIAEENLPDAAIFWRL